MPWTRIAIGLAALATALGVRPPPPDALLIRGARVFDGTGAAAVIEDVLVRGDRIAAIGRHLRAGGTRVIDARGLTLLPGLHDLHIHGRAPAIEAAEDLGKAYASYLLHGVTAVNDYSVSGEMLGPIRAMTGSGTASGAVPAPRLTLAIRLGVPGGHGTEFGWGDGFTLEAATPRAAHRAMAAALAYHPDMIKVFADGWRYGRDPALNSINQETLSAIVADAHAAGLPVVTHTVTLQGAKIAAAAGVDAVGHGVGDAPVDDALIAAMRMHHMGYIATLSAFEPLGARTLLPAEAASLRPEERAAETENTSERIPAYEARRWAIMRDNIARLHAARVAIGVGTDAGVIGVYHGAAAIREIRLLADAGLTPREALAAATGVSAAIMHRADEGRIAVGARADLVLTGGRPDERVEDLYDVRRVWVGGREVPLARLRKLIDAPSPSPLPVRATTGPIDTGARADGRTDLNTMPVESSDAGVDHSRLTVVRRAGGRLLVARFGAGTTPYAQWALPLTPGGVVTADARGFAGVAFTVRGEGAATLLLDSYGLREEAWFRAAIVADDTVREVRVPFADLRSPDDVTLDLAKLRAVVVRMEGQPGGRSWLEIGGVRFYR